MRSSHRTPSRLRASDLIAKRELLEHAAIAVAEAYDSGKPYALERDALVHAAIDFDRVQREVARKPRRTGAAEVHYPTPGVAPLQDALSAVHGGAPHRREGRP